MQVLKKPTIIETVRLNRLCWFVHVQRMEGNRIPKRVLYMNLGTIRLRGRPRNRWKDEVREDGRTVGGEGWQEKVHNREEWQKLLRMANDRRILHVPTEWMKGMTAPPPVGQGLLVIEDSWSHSDTPHSVGLLWTSDQPDAQISTNYQYCYIRL